MVNKKTAALISGAVGVCMLSTAALASYGTMNGYDALKESVMGTMDYTNCTGSIGVVMAVDGEDKLRTEILAEYDLENKMSHDAARLFLHGNEVSSSDIYSVDTTNYVRDQNSKYHVYTDTVPTRETVWGIDEDSRELAEKAIRFTELACDMVVGDLKNNFVCTEDSDDAVSYSISLDSVQIPELINAGLSMVFSMTNSDTYSAEYAQEEDSVYYYTMLLGDDPILDSMDFSFTINKDGTFRSGNMTTAFSGNGHTITFNVTGDISKVGETSVVLPEDIEADTAG